jgi:hypothetical protein
MKGRRMRYIPQVDEIEALRRAKRNCERDGWIWDASVFTALKGSLPSKSALDRMAVRNISLAPACKF